MASHTDDGVRRGIGSLAREGRRGARADGHPLSLRAYGLALSGLVFLGFAAMGACSSLFGNVDFLFLVLEHYLGLSIATWVASLVGIVLMGVARRSGSVGLSLAGYAVFVLSFGFSLSTALLMFTPHVISTAFYVTAGIVAVFACAGLVFPHVFQRIRGVLMVALAALVVVELFAALTGTYQTWVDYAVIVVFCGFIGHDFHAAMVDEPTLVNAVFNASNLFLDIVNVFVSVLSILGDRT